MSVNLILMHREKKLKEWILLERSTSHDLIQI